VNRKLLTLICTGVFLLNAAALWSQQEDSAQQSAPASSAANAAEQPPDQNQNQAGDQMLTPPLVSGQSYPTEPASQERSNYLRGGVAFTSAYSDNALGSVNGHPISDESYSIAPMLALDETTPRLHLVSTYAPGFTFYQHESNLNLADQNAAVDFHYRLSPHVTLSIRDGFQRTSSVFNQPDVSEVGAVAPGAQPANFSVIAPIADRLNNSGNVGITYQFSMNAMVGANGTFSNLHYPNPAEVAGLYDSSTQGGSAFYSHRISKLHYLGATYQYQRLASYPGAGLNETQTHAVLLFYTLYPNSRFSLSFFGGPQYSDTVQPPLAPLPFALPAIKAWTPATGGSLNWQERVTAFSMSYSHIISGGGGLIGAVHMDGASASVRRQITRGLSGSLAASYVQNDVIGSFFGGNYNGHTISATASLQQTFRQNISLQFGYTRLRQDYSGVAVLASAPTTNREFFSLSYQFSRPLGR
jgi:hypothetical protein